MEWLKDDSGIYPIVPVEGMNKIFPNIAEQLRVAAYMIIKKI